MLSLQPWKILFFVIAGLTILSLAILWNPPSNVAAQPIPSAQRTPILVELFTSEGCSSCPPADAVLAELESKQPVANAQIIALGEHVDYWNYLGWSDPYSAAIFGERQQAYAQSLNANTYTPQMVIDGKAEFVGSNTSKALAAIAKAASAPKAKLEITKTAPDKIKVIASELPPSSGKPDIVLAITENNLSTNVSRGENAGRRLNHRTVTRSLNVIGQFPSAEAAITIDKSWKRENVRIVAFLQERNSRRILGAAMIAL